MIDMKCQNLSVRIIKIENLISQNHLMALGKNPEYMSLVQLDFLKKGVQFFLEFLRCLFCLLHIYSLRFQLIC